MILEVTKKQFKYIMSEEIDAAQAYDDMNALMTVVDGERDIATIEYKTMFDDEYDKLIDEHDLNKVKLNSTKHDLFIIYRDGYESEVNELQRIARKNNGYLPFKSTEDETRRIGQLLQYKKEDIDNYIKDKYYNGIT